MPIRPLPKKLNKEPLVDAVFEIRFSGSMPASSVLPGFFFAKLKHDQWAVENLPIAQIPIQIRTLDPNLRYQPLMKLDWGKFFIVVGDTSLGVGCKIPYPGWAEFKKGIIEIVNLLRDSNIVQKIERYSLKYVDLIESGNLAEQIECVDIDIRIGSHILRNENFTVRVEVPKNDFISMIQIAAPAKATLPGGINREGTLVDIDTVCNYSTNDLNQFTAELAERLDLIHTQSEEVFFGCLKDETINLLEPVYNE